MRAAECNEKPLLNALLCVMALPRRCAASLRLAEGRSEFIGLRPLVGDLREKMWSEPASQGLAAHRRRRAQSSGVLFGLAVRIEVVNRRAGPSLDQ